MAADMAISGVLLYIGLSLAGLHFALMFSAFTALMVLIPTFGGFISGIPPVLYALSDSPARAAVILGIYIAQQQIEGNLILPLIMSRTTSLHPAVIAVGVVLVAALFGLVGLFIAVPIISAVVILVEELWVKPRERSAPVSAGRRRSLA
jgi:predicted PurR-regulated permease PerM